MNNYEPKVVATGSLAPVGHKLLKPKLAQKRSKGLNYWEYTIDTKKLIDYIQHLIGMGSKKEDWPIDAEHNPDITKSLSYSKMINEINHREPRAYTSAGQITTVSVCGSGTGRHSMS